MIVKRYGFTSLHPHYYRYSIAVMKGKSDSFSFWLLSLLGCIFKVRSVRVRAQHACLLQAAEGLTYETKLGASATCWVKNSNTVPVPHRQERAGLQHSRVACKQADYRTATFFRHRPESTLAGLWVL